MADDRWVRFQSVRFTYCIDLPDRGWEHQIAEHTDSWTGTYLEMAERGTTLDLALALVFLQIGQDAAGPVIVTKEYRASIETAFEERFGAEAEAMPSIRTPAGEARVYGARVDTQYGPMEVQTASIVNEWGAYWILLETREGFPEEDTELFELLLGSLRMGCE